MKKYSSIIIRVIAVVMAAVSLYLLLLSPATVKISDTHEMARTVIDKTAQQSEDPDLKNGVNIVKESGLEDTLINSLPKNYQINFSYADIYHLTSVYDEEGRISSKDIGLNAQNRLEDVIDRFITEAVNMKLREESGQVAHLINIYRYSIFVIVLLYLLAAILFIFKHYSAVIPLILGSLSSFGALWYFCLEANSELQSKIYSGISINLNAGIWCGLIIALVLVIVWPFLLKIIRKNEQKDA